jgi:hypothetical protein
VDTYASTSYGQPPRPPAMAGTAIRPKNLPIPTVAGPESLGTASRLRRSPAERGAAEAIMQLLDEPGHARPGVSLLVAEPCLHPLAHGQIVGIAMPLRFPALLMPSCHALLTLIAGHQCPLSNLPWGLQASMSITQASETAAILRWLSVSRVYPPY